jgi:hypothetical protein
MSGIISKQINNKNILFYFDAANLKSYNGTSNVGYSLVLGTTASLLTGVTWSTVNSGVMRFNGTYSAVPNITTYTGYTKDSWITCGDRIPKLGLSFPFTLEAWINPKKLNGLTTTIPYGVFALDSTESFSLNGSISYYYGLDLGLSTNDGTDTHNFTCGYYNGTGYGSGARRSTITLERPVICGNWNHVVAVVSALNTFTFYINGESTPIELVGSEFGSGENTSGIVWSGGIGKTVIGKGAGYYKYIFNGDIAMVRAYNSALSADNIKQNYNLHAVRFGLNIK